MSKLLLANKRFLVWTSTLGMVVLALSLVGAERLFVPHAPEFNRDLLRDILFFGVIPTSVLISAPFACAVASRLKAKLPAKALSVLAIVFAYTLTIDLLGIAVINSLPGLHSNC